jgi:predicted dehydrogenase
MSAPIRLGFCGGGWVVRNCYAPALERCSRRLPVTAIVEPNATHWPSLRILFPEAEIATTREALYSGLVDAVVVASPNATHLDNAVATLKAGIPCLVEKPVLRNSADLGRLRRAASRGRVALLASAACRHRADARSWLECCSKISPLRRLDLVWHRHRGVPATDWHLAASDGWTGVLADLGAHLLDLAGAALLWQCDGLLLRRRTASVPSFAAPAGWYGGGATREITVCDQFAAEITLAGCSLTLSVRWRDDEPGDLVRLEAVGDRGRCCLEGLFGFSGERRVAHQRLMTTTGGIGAVQDFATGPAPQIAGFAAMLDNFATRCREGWSEAPDLAFLARVGDALTAVEA